MIRPWANVVSRRFFEEGATSKFRGMDHEAAQELLGALEAATDLKDLSPLKLKGDRKGQWAMTVNGPWRICFRFRKGDAYGVEIVDYHRR